MTMATVPLAEQRTHMQHALSLARLSLPSPSDFCVGCVLVDPSTSTVLSTGYTRELPGKTHAEACAIDKYLAALPSPAESRLADAHLYATMEPCSVRLSGLVDCTSRILESGIRTVFVGVKEPRDFVECEGVGKLEEGGVVVRLVEAGLGDECLSVARRGSGIGEC